MAEGSNRVRCNGNMKDYLSHLAFSTSKRHHE